MVRLGNGDNNGDNPEKNSQRGSGLVGEALFKVYVEDAALQNIRFRTFADNVESLIFPRSGAAPVRCVDDLDDARRLEFGERLRRQQGQQQQ